jgi:hypothetical protein
MNLGKFKYKSLLLGVGASMILATSCKDFLDVDVYDNYSPSALSNKSAYEALTYPLYGGYKWYQYEGKFSWCVNEGASGILYNRNDQEGALYALSMGEDNAILKEGYTSLYSGVIAHANSVIKLVSDSLDKGSIPSGMQEKDLASVLAEARFFRGYAHFLATEYFGEVPLVMDTESDISGNVILPCVSRKTVYRAIEEDLCYAVDNLPETPVTINNVPKIGKGAAQALLAKLYLTMASCQTATPGLVFPYVCDNPTMYLDSAIKLLNKVVESKVFELRPHKEIFAEQSLIGGLRTTKEDIFSLYWDASGGKYGDGSSYQAQMSATTDWGPGSGWGAGKGLSYTLYNSFADEDLRKKELCLFVGSGTGNKYEMSGGKTYFCGSGYSKKLYDSGETGKDFFSRGSHLLNNIKKYVWGVNGSSVHGSGMVVSRVQHVIRYSDVKLMLAEANYLKLFGTNVTEITSDKDVIDPINEVLVAHGAPTIDSIAYFTDFSEKHLVGQEFPFTVTVDNGNGGSETKTILVKSDRPMFHEEIRGDLVQQRRKEFAMEGHGWLDLKRFYYLNPEMATKFMWQMDRSCSWTNSPSVNANAPELQNESGYARLALVNLCNDTLSKMFPKDKFPNADYKVGDPELSIFLEEFLARNRWYLPIPLSAKQYLGGVRDMYDEVYNGTYPY